MSIFHFCSSLFVLSQQLFRPSVKLLRHIVVLSQDKSHFAQQSFGAFPSLGACFGYSIPIKTMKDNAIIQFIKSVLYSPRWLTVSFDESDSPTKALNIAMVSVLSTKIINQNAQSASVKQKSTNAINLDWIDDLHRPYQ